MLTDETGTLSDDQTGAPIDCTGGGCGGADASCFGGICSGGRNGYSDNLDCGKHIHAPTGNTVSIIFTYLALETGSTCPQPGATHFSFFSTSSSPLHAVRGAAMHGAGAWSVNTLTSAHHLSIQQAATR